LIGFHFDCLQLVRDYLKETSLLLQILREKTKVQADIEAQLIFELEKRLSLVCTH